MSNIYSTIKKKDGRKLVLLDLVELFNEREDKELFLDGGDEHWRIECPLDDCPKDPKVRYDANRLYKMYVTKELHKAYCHRCGTGFINVNEKLDLELKLEQPTFRLPPFELVKLQSKDWSLTDFLSWDTESDEGLEYLNGRHKYFGLGLYKALKLRFLDNAVAIPFYFHKELIFFQLRFIENRGIKYFTPPIKKKPIFVIERANNKRLVICEGVFDAIACLFLYPDRTPIAIIGSTPTPYQVMMIRSYVPEDILVFMDNTELSIKVSKILRYHIDYAVFGIEFSSGQDPEEKLQVMLKAS